MIHTNLNLIVFNLNANIFSLKKTPILFKQNPVWNTKMFRIDNDTEKYINSYITSNVFNEKYYISNIIIETVFYNTYDYDAYYFLHQYDAEIYYFGIPLWIATFGLALVPVILYNFFDWVVFKIYDNFLNIRTQSCNITFTVRPKKSPNNQ
jgi:hypothetical protein